MPRAKSSRSFETFLLLKGSVANQARLGGVLIWQKQTLLADNHVAGPQATARSDCWGRRTEPQQSIDSPLLCLRPLLRLLPDYLTPVLSLTQELLGQLPRNHVYLVAHEA